MKIVVITGSRRGLGHGMAVSFLEQGCRVVINGRNEDEVSEVVAKLAEKYGDDRVTGCAANIASYIDLKRLWQRPIDVWGASADIWINNAAVSVPMKSLSELEPQQLKSIVDVNVTGFLLANKVVLSEMLAKDSGEIWNIQGLGAQGRKVPSMTVYAATYNALNALTQGVQAELKGTNVKVSSANPGIVITDLLRESVDQSSAHWSRTRRIFNIFGDRVEVVAPWVVSQIMQGKPSGSYVDWLPYSKRFIRVVSSMFKRRELI